MTDRDPNLAFHSAAGAAPDALDDDPHPSESDSSEYNLVELKPVNYHDYIDEDEEMEDDEEEDQDMELEMEEEEAEVIDVDDVQDSESDTQSHSGIVPITTQQDEEFRNATNLFLGGHISIRDLASSKIVRKMNAEADADTEIPEEEAQPIATTSKLDLVELKHPPLPSIKHAPDEVTDCEAGPYDDDDLNIESRRREFPRPGFYGTGTSSSSFTLQKKKLSTTFQNLIGEAHIQFARGNHDATIEICNEIIKEQPTCAEPYQTLSMVYETLEDSHKSLQYGLLAACLGKERDANWARLGEKSMEHGYNSEALFCFKKASKAEPLNPEFHIKKAHLYKLDGNTKAALKSYFKVSQTFPEITPDRGDLFVLALKESAIIYYQSDQAAEAYNCLTEAFEKYPTFVSISESNLMLDLCISMKKYVQAIEILIKYAGVQFEPEIKQEYFNSRESLSGTFKSNSYQCYPPVNFPVDLLSRLIIALAHLEAFSVSDKLVQDLFLQSSVETCHDLYLEVAEAYMSKQNEAFALNLLKPLIDSDKYSLAAVWLRYAECLYLLSRYEEASTAYERVVQLAPSHNLSKLNLSVILRKLGRTDDALETLSQGKDAEPIDHELLIQKCHILHTAREYPLFLQTAMSLLRRHSLHIRSKEDAFVIVMVTNYGKRYQAVLADRHSRGEVAEDLQLDFMDKHIDEEKEFRVYLKLCKTLCAMERYDLLSRVTYTACASKVFSKVAAIENECELHSFISSLRMGDEDLLPQHMRIFLNRYPQNPIIYNLSSLVIRNSEPTRYHKQIQRQLKKFPNNHALLLLNAHLSFAGGSYKDSLLEYMSMYAKNSTNNPLVPLMIACVLLHVSVQKSTPGRMQLTKSATAFLKQYLNLRGDCQESFYNLGRAFHFMGRYGIAIEWYKKALEIKPTIHKLSSLQKAFYEDDQNIFDLKSEIGFNLALIYKYCGKMELARSVLLEYCTI